MSLGIEESMSEAVDLPFDTWRAALTDGVYEDVSQALEEVVARLELGQLRLADSIACYELGVQLAERCEKILAEAELRVSRLETALEIVETWDVDKDDDDAS